jgi:hypothetical protein
MEPTDHEPSLNDDDALSLWVGRVARSHAHLEFNVDNVHRFLVRQHGHLPDNKSAKSFDQLVSECRNLLKGLNADREIQTSGDAALHAAKEASVLRNRVVHDMWLPDPLRDGWEPPRWNTFRRLGDLHGSYTSATLQDLTAVVDTHTLLMRTRIRVSGLFMALHAIWPAGRNPGEGSSASDNMARYVALMTDRFTLHPNGDFDVT